MSTLLRVVSGVSHYLPRAPLAACLNRFHAPRHASYSTGVVSPAMKERIDTLVKEQSVVVFMKGVPSAPQCGFSNAVMKILTFHGLSDVAGGSPSKDDVGVFSAHDILADEDLREAIKLYSSWPTIPQVYMGGEFVGGCDIMLDMHKTGELIEELHKVGIRSALLNPEKKEPET